MYNADMTNQLSQQLDRILWGDTLSQYGVMGRIVRAVLRNLYAVLRDMFAGQLTLRAMSLVYTTLLSVVPLIAFSFALLKGFGVDQLLEDKMYVVLEPLGEKGKEITDNVMRLVQNVNGGLLGGVSLAFFMYTAISMVQKVEEAFNYAWYVSKPRSFARRFTEYVFVLTIGPVAIVLALGMIGSLQDEGFVQFLLDNQIVGPLFVATSKVAPFLLVTAAFAFLYWFMPNTHVRTWLGTCWRLRRWLSLGDSGCRSRNFYRQFSENNERLRGLRDRDYWLDLVVPELARTAGWRAAGFLPSEPGLPENRPSRTAIVRQPARATGAQRDAVGRPGIS